MCTKALIFQFDASSYLESHEGKCPEYPFVCSSRIIVLHTRLFTYWLTIDKFVIQI